MTVGIDIRVLGSRTKSGIEEYTENLLSQLIPLDPSIKYKLFYSSLRNNLPSYEWLSFDNVEVKKFRWPNKMLFTSARFFNRPYIDELLGGVDVFFSPHFFLAPLSWKCKRVTTIHDLSFIRFKEFFSWRKIAWHRLEMNPLEQCKLSDLIITVSESTKKDLENLFNIDPQKISVVPSGIDSHITRPSEDELNKFRREKNLPHNFILSLGKIEPRKNILGLIRAFNKLKETNKFLDLNLVIIGARGWLYHDVFKESKKSRYSKNIIFTSYINDNEKRYYYSLANCFVYPSFFEGFGFPNLEAMICGTPVVTSNSSSIPEVVGNGPILINPNSVGEIAQAITNILVDTKLSKSVVSGGLLIAKKYDWKASAIKTMELITRISNV